MPAIKAGFPPDSISTDLHLSSLNGAALDTLHTVSKCIAMGMPLQEAIYRATVTPARVIRRPELGTLSEGAEADVAVLRWVDRPRNYADCGGAQRRRERAVLRCKQRWHVRPQPGRWIRGVASSDRELDL